MRPGLPLFILLSCLFGGAVWDAAGAIASQTEVFYFPQSNLSTEDIDPRDNNNQPINTLTAKENLENVFTSGLFTILVKSEIHSIAQALSIIRKTLKLGASSLARDVSSAAAKFFYAIFPSSRQWGKILICLSSCFAFSLLAVYFHLPSSILHPSFSKTSPLYLRC